jgi:hypothetical protein
MDIIAMSTGGVERSHQGNRGPVPRMDDETAHPYRGRGEYGRRGGARWRAGGLMGSLTADGGSPFPMPQPPPNADPQTMASLKQAQVLTLI